MRVRFTEENGGEEPTNEDISRRGAIYVRSMPKIYYPPKYVSPLEFGSVNPDPYTYPEPREFRRYLREIYWKDKLVGTIHIELNASEAKYSIAVRYVY